ncbi:MAG TPA: BON domain-containing protein, partial [Vicinamibacterales bacterium]
MTATACSREPARTDQTATTATTATPATPATPAGQSAGSVDADWWTTTKVQAKFFADTGVKGRNINVDTNDGVVALRGEVDSAAAKERAVTLARQVDGVARVDDQLTVRPEHQADDARPVPTSGTTGANINAGWITTKIQAQYFADPDIKPWNIDVTTMANGHVTLRGEVDDANDRSKAVAIARNTEGVAAVDDKLRVRGDNEGAAGAA